MELHLRLTVACLLALMGYLQARPTPNPMPRYEDFDFDLSFFECDGSPTPAVPTFVRLVKEKECYTKAVELIISEMKLLEEKCSETGELSFPLEEVSKHLGNTTSSTCEDPKLVQKPLGEFLEEVKNLVERIFAMSKESS